VRHYRSVVERHGGELIHHDGGVEERDTRLPALVQRADAVFCSTSCVSHKACLQIKRVCKRRARPLVLLRSSGVSSVTFGLRELATLDVSGGERECQSGANATLLERPPN
jgi:hypothetical protein